MKNSKEKLKINKKYGLEFLSTSKEGLDAVLATLSMVRVTMLPTRVNLTFPVWSAVQGPENVILVVPVS